MNKYLTCPNCQGVLKIMHYNKDHPSGKVLIMSGLKCGCGYKKEPKMPDKLFSIDHAKELKHILDD